MRALFFLAGVALALGGCSTTAEKQALTSAYESCKGRTGEARDRCIAAEKTRFEQERAAFNERCQAEIDASADRSAMIAGRRTGDPLTEAAGDGCER